MSLDVGLIIDPIFNPGTGIRLAIDSVTPLLTAFLTFLQNSLPK